MRSQKSFQNILDEEIQKRTQASEKHAFQSFSVTFNPLKATSTLSFPWQKVTTPRSIRTPTKDPYRPLLRLNFQGEKTKENLSSDKSEARAETINTPPQNEPKIYVFFLSREQKLAWKRWASLGAKPFAGHSVTPSEFKTAYRQLVKDFHPDHTGEATTAEHFMQIQRDKKTLAPAFTTKAFDT